MSSFSDLHLELLSNISNRLGLIDLLSFHGVSKNTRSVSFDSSIPWFLLYGHDGPHCSVLVTNNNTRRRYNIHLPEIAGDSTCVFSLNRWLLFISPDSSIFFFCPFSRAKINLPKNCPFTLHDSHFAAAFSHSPTHTDCSVVVLRRHCDFLELCFLRRGDSEWRRWHYNYYLPIYEFKGTLSVIHHDGAFHFLDGIHGVVIFDDKLNKGWSNGVIVPATYTDDAEDNKIGVKYNINMNHRFGSVCSVIMCWTSKEMKSDLGIEEACSISICGTSILRRGCVYHLIPHGIVRSQLKGVWIQPRFHQISCDQRW